MIDDMDARAVKNLIECLYILAPLDEGKNQDILTLVTKAVSEIVRLTNELHTTRAELLDYKNGTCANCGCSIELLKGMKP
jgi:hypothetical protein